MCILPNPNSPRTVTEMSTCNSFISYYIHNGSHPSLSKLWHRGLYFTLYWRSARRRLQMPARICTSSLPPRCIYITADERRAVWKVISRRGSRGETRSREQRGCLSLYGSLGGLFYVSRLEPKWHAGRHSWCAIDLVVRAKLEDGCWSWEEWKLWKDFVSMERGARVRLMCSPPPPSPPVLLLQVSLREVGAEEGSSSEETGAAEKR